MENCKTEMKETTDLKNREFMPMDDKTYCYGVRSSSFLFLYQLQFQSQFFVAICKQIGNYIWIIISLRVANIILKENKVEGLIPSNFRLTIKLQ